MLHKGFLLFGRKKKAVFSSVFCSPIPPSALRTTFDEHSSSKQCSTGQIRAIKIPSSQSSVYLTRLPAWSKHHALRDPNWSMGKAKNPRAVGCRPFPSTHRTSWYPPLYKVTHIHNAPTTTAKVLTIASSQIIAFQTPQDISTRQRDTAGNPPTLCRGDGRLSHTQNTLRLLLYRIHTSSVQAQ